MTQRTILSLAALALAAPLLLAACTPGTPNETAGPLDPSGSATAVPTETPSPAPPTPAAPLPPTCTDLVSLADPAQFGSAPLNDPALVPYGPSGVRAPIEPSLGVDGEATLAAIAELTCLWEDPANPASMLLVEAGHATQEKSAAVASNIQQTTSSCIDRSAGTLCSYDVDATSFTFFIRDEIMIMVKQTAFPTNELMAGMIARIWP